MAATRTKRAGKPRTDLGRLRSAIQTARLALRRFRAERREMIRQFVGNHWSDEGTAEKVPVNLISMYVTIVGRSLVPKNPRGLFSTFDRKALAVVEAEQEWCNRQVEKMRLDRTLTRWVNDALFSLGILKVGLVTPADASQMSWGVQAGEPFAERVDLDDFVYDVHARDFEEAGFVGHRYRVPLDAVRDSTLYSKGRKKLNASDDPAFNQEGDERVSVLGRGYHGSSDEFIPHVDLWEIYVPGAKTVLTLADDFDEEDEPLRVQEWVGPDQGPYHFLGYQWVPDSAMPKGPVQDLYDLHMFVNETYRKLMRQSQRQKDNVAVMGTTEDGTRLMNANDGDIVPISNPDRLKPISSNPGPNQANLLMAQHAYQLFSRQGMNLEILGGLAPQSKTASQDKMLMQSATGQMAAMQQDTRDGVERVFQSLCWYFHHHPQATMRVVHQLPGLPDRAIVRRVSPQQRQALRYDDLDITIDVYSLQGQTPQTKVAAILQVLGAVQPFMQLAAQQGVVPDINAMMAKFSRFLDLPELLEIFSIQEPPAAEGQTPEGQGPASTSHESVRRSLGGESQQAQEGDMMNTLMEGMSQAQGRNGTMPMNPNGATP